MYCFSKGESERGMDAWPGCFSARGDWAGSGWLGQAGFRSQSPPGVPGSGYLSYHLLLPRVSISLKLQPRADPSFEPRHSESGCDGLSHGARCLPCLLLVDLTC